MSIAMLRTLIAIHDLGSFSAAAEAVSVTQAAVSQQMRTLEHQWSVALFDRSRRPPALTASGRALAERARPVVNGYDALAPTAFDGLTLRGECRLGSVPTALTGLVPLAVQTLDGRVPQLRINIVSGLTHALIADVQQGRLDMALVSRPRVLEDDLSWHAVADEPLELIVPPECAVEPVEQLLRQRPFIRFARAAIVGELTEAWLQQRGIAVQERMVVEELQATAHLVMSTRSVAIVPRQCVETLRPVPVSRLSLGTDAPVRQLGLVCLATVGQNALLRVVADALRDAVEIGHFDAT
ncbi:MAG: LysR family transcriptional regulator [Pseudomonadota bacterium]